MQIHELNNFSGTLGSGAYLAIDDGNDTGKISSQGLLAATEARIDNIIAGEAPSAEEVVDARLGADGVTYASLGTGIRSQFTDVKSALSDEETARIALAGRVTTAESDIDTLETHKVAQPLDEFNQPTDGTDGQLLRTKGDGSTEWVDEGLPTDEQTAQAVSNWLDAHPEATTTVQDGAITRAKLSAQLVSLLETELDSISIPANVELQNVIYRNLVITYSPTLTIKDNCKFYGCKFICDTLQIGDDPAIMIVGEDSIFDGCSFTGVSLSTTQIQQEKTAFNSKFINCTFDGTFKSPLNLGSSNNNLVSGCYFAPIYGSATNIYQLKLTSAGPMADTSYRGTGKTVITNCYFDGDPDELHVAIDFYSSGYETIVSNCIFKENNSITIKTDWRDFDSEDEGGTCINDYRYSHDIIIQGCLFLRCNRLRIANTQYGSTNIGVTVPNNIMIDGCMFVDVKYGIATTDNLVTSAESFISVKNCTFYNSYVGKIALKDVVLDGCEIVNTKALSSSIWPGLLVIGNTNNDVNSVTIRNCTFRDLSLSSAVTSIHQSGAVNELRISDCVFETSYSEFIRTVTTRAAFSRLIIDGVEANKPIMTSNGTNIPLVAIIRNSFFNQAYALTRTSSSAGYGANTLYLFNVIVIGKTKVVNPATGYTDTDHEVGCVAISS